FIGQDPVLDVKGVTDRPVYVGIRPEGFILKEDGPMTCKLIRVEVMGRDISVVSEHTSCINANIRSIIGTDHPVDTTKPVVRFSLKPQKVHLFDRETEERIPF
ncbi:MAG: ABC transporter ATP-binding protein, partial [Blautia sp.]|nr:ABC transporter ATP-binding protein [Blautia sp.]